MTIQTDRVQEIFQDARLLQAAAVDRLDQGDIRDASEKAWGATKRATDALVLARTGDEPERTPQTSTELRHLEGLDQDVRQAGLVARYYTRQGHLHGECFYLGLCEPLADTELRIRETADYIDDAQRLASCIGVLSHLPPVSTWPVSTWPVSISFKRFISKHREW